MRIQSSFAVVFALALAGCGNGGSAVETRDRETQPLASPAAASAADAGSDASSPVEAERGSVVWQAARGSDAESTAEVRFERNGSDFGAESADDYVDQVHAFITNPPPGTQRAQRRNGDTLFYDPASNTFAVVTRDGAPRTMFKPDEGAAYWAQQLEQIERQASRG